MGSRLRSGSSWRRRISSPPTSQRLLQSQLKVVLDALRRSRSSRKGMNVATMAAPGGEICRFVLPSPGPVVQIRTCLPKQSKFVGRDNPLLVDNARSWPAHAAHPPAQCLPSFSRICVHRCAPDRSPQDHRDRGPTTGRLPSPLLGLSAAGAWLRSTAPAPLRVHSGVGLRRGTALSHAARAVPRLWRQSRAGVLGGRQTGPSASTKSPTGAATST